MDDGSIVDQNEVVSFTTSDAIVDSGKTDDSNTLHVSTDNVDDSMPLSRCEDNVEDM